MGISGPTHLLGITVVTTIIGMFTLLDSLVVGVTLSIYVTPFKSLFSSRDVTFYLLDVGEPLFTYLECSYCNSLSSLCVFSAKYDDGLKCGLLRKS